jgi:predicted permease
MDGLRQDLGGALRMLLRSPGFCAVVVVTLAVAVGATTSVFSVVRGLLLRPLPYRDPAQLVRFYASTRQAATGTISAAEYREDYERLHSASVAGWGYGSGSLAGEGPPLHIGLGRATASLLPVLGVKPAYGRWFTRDEEEPGRGRVVVLGRSLWQRRFGGDPAAVGKTVEIAGMPHLIVGVLADDLELPESFDAWRPLAFTPDQLTVAARANHFLRVIGRAKGSLADLRSELAVVSAHSRAAYPAVYPADLGYEMTSVPLRDQMVSHVRLVLWMLFFAVALVLLMACANVGNLLLARATARDRELAVRAALGAGRGRLVRQMLVESLFLSLLGGGLGLLLAYWGVDLLLLSGPELPRAKDVRIDGAVLAFALGVSVLSGLLFGALPALLATQERLHDSLRGGTSSSGRRPRRLRQALVTADVALALVLVTGAALLLRSFGRVVHVDPGFQAAGAVSFTVGVTGSDDHQRQVFRAVLQRMRELPSATAAGGVDYAPLSGVANDNTFELEGHPVPADTQPPDEEVRLVTPGWFEAMGLRLLRGRTFQETDASPLAVVNDAFARKYLTGDGLGQRFHLTGDPRFFQVVGVVGNLSEFGLDADAPPIFYLPTDQVAANTLTLTLRSKAPSREALKQALQAVSSVDPSLAAWQVSPVADVLARSLAQREFALVLLHGFALVALLLAGLGLYGVLAYAVTQRTREIGVRMALGASPVQALLLVAREGFAVVGAGLGAGVLGALLAAKAFAGLLFGIGPTDPLALAGAVCLLALVAVLAMLLPARRAARVDPAVALRAE